MWIVGIRTLVCTYVWPALLPLSRLTPWSFSTGLNSFLVTPGLELRAFHLLSKCSARHGACFHPRATGNISRKSAKKTFRVLFCKKVACNVNAGVKIWKILMNCCFNLRSVPAAFLAPLPELCCEEVLPHWSEKSTAGISKQSLILP